MLRTDVRVNQGYALPAPTPGNRLKTIRPSGQDTRASFSWWLVPRQVGEQDCDGQLVGCDAEIGNRKLRSGGRVGGGGAMGTGNYCI